MSDLEERRRHARKVAVGGVILRFEGIPEDVPGKLVDESESGFRARHRNLAITGNQRVDFHTSSRSGEARVIWNRILGKEVETGFVIVESD